jgi:hypothetical protein
VYAVAWCDHGVNPKSAKSEYAILVSADAAGIEALRVAQTSHSPRYEVLMKNSAAHVVRFGNNGAPPSETYGYAFFEESAISLAEGPVKGVSAECIVMAEIDYPNFTNINLSVSSPDLNYNTTKKLHDIRDAGVNEYFYMRSQPVRISVNLRMPVFLKGVVVNGNL